MTPFCTFWGMVNKDKQVKKFPITERDCNVERIAISLLPLSSSELWEFVFTFKKHTLKHHMLNCAVTAQGLKHCKESCFRFIEIPFPVDRGGSNFGQSEECPFSAIIIGKILLPIYANHDDAQPSCGACHHSMLEVCPACVSALRCLSPAAKRPESYV